MLSHVRASFEFFSFFHFLFCCVSFDFFNFSCFPFFFNLAFLFMFFLVFCSCVSFHFWKVLYIRAGQRQRAGPSVPTSTKVFEFVKLILRPQRSQEFRHAKSKVSAMPRPPFSEIVVAADTPVNLASDHDRPVPNGRYRQTRGKTWAEIFREAIESSVSSIADQHDKNGQGRRTGVDRSLEQRCFSHQICEPNFKVTMPMWSCMPKQATACRCMPLCHCKP